MSHAHIEDVKRKGFFGLQTIDPLFAQTSRLVTDVDRDFTTASPFMEFLATALDLPYAQK